MKRWALLTVLLYLLTLLFLTVPCILIFALQWSWRGYEGIHLAGPASEAWLIYKEWGYWIWLGILGSGQACLLFVPLQVAQKKLMPRRHLYVPVFTASFLLANLCFAGGSCILFLLYRDGAFEFMETFSKAMAKSPFWMRMGPLFGPGVMSNSDLIALAGALSVTAILWALWALLFYRFAKTDSPDAVTKRAVRWLLRGSILELLVAVPSHIVVRGRGDCCAPIGTFWGMVTGLSVMLLAFGPGVFFLFVERARRLRPAEKTPVSPRAEAQQP